MYRDTGARGQNETGHSGTMSEGILFIAAPPEGMHESRGALSSWKRGFGPRL